MRTLRTQFELEGPVIVDAGAKFLRPVTYGDLVVARAWISEWNAKTFRVEHRFAKDGDEVCAGHELRAWAVPDKASPTGISAASIPETFRQLFQFVSHFPQVPVSTAVDSISTLARSSTRAVTWTTAMAGK